MQQIYDVILCDYQENVSFRKTNIFLRKRGQGHISRHIPHNIKNIKK